MAPSLRLATTGIRADGGHHCFPRCCWSPVLWTTTLTCVFALMAHVMAQSDPFAALVRPTEPLSPSQEREALRVPPGFVVELVASEPDILKPLNMAFDVKGRLWVTVTTEYPFPAPPDRPGRDAVKILEDTDGDGRADKIITFADELNIPIGVYPYQQGAIVFSIPHIWYLEDTDGDDRADRRIKLYGPMGYERDTHGMNNAFRRGLDGWLYACHGFNNETRVAGTDGHEVVMHSGNTYRMRVDGARIEHFTFGQVNPFGMTMDEWFRLFTADCHSKPIYQLIRNGYYPSFGKPHDGLGFVPPLMDHLHGSTAIAGVVCYVADQFPPEYRGNFFSGNVMTSRVNRNSVIEHGATIRLREEPDFVVSSDPWFRPVDLCLGPDGALYIADFYNRIIGHYEVPLDHPGRDRTRGRIWRVRYVGDAPTVANQPPPVTARFDLSNASVDELIRWFEHPNLTCRMLATDALSDRVAMAAVETLISAFRTSPSPTARLHSLWVLFRLGQVTPELVVAAVKDSQALVQAHGARVAAELPQWPTSIQSAVVALLRHSDPRVQIAAADALAVHVEVDAAEPIFQALSDADAKDLLLIHALRIALRNQCRDESRLARLARKANNQHARQQLIAICPSLYTSVAAGLLLDHLRHQDVPDDQALSYARHIASWADPHQLVSFIAWIDDRFHSDLATQLFLLEAIEQGLAERGASCEQLPGWASRLAGRLSESLAACDVPWINYPAAARPSANPWLVQVRPCSDGNNEPLLCSLPRGESLTGCLRSKEFVIPEELSFFVAGHDGFPDRPLQGKNVVRLRHAVSGTVLMQQPAPRNDLAQPVTWNLRRWTGQRAFLELVDADDGGAYAWLAAGRFEPPVVRVPHVAPAERADRAAGFCRLVARFKLAEFRPKLLELIRSDDIDPLVRAAAVEAESVWSPQPHRVLLAAAMREESTPERLLRQAGQLATNWNQLAFLTWAGELMKTAPAAAQHRFAELLSQSHDGFQVLLSLVESGCASPRLLQSSQIQQRMRAFGESRWSRRVAELTAGLPEPNEQVQQLIQERRQQFLATGGNVQAGQAVFRRVCSACHQLEGQGAVVGPQLDGIGNRGLDRLLEDLLDPHRNVDVAFRTVILELSDGRVLVALPRGQQGKLLVFVDEKGEPFMLSPEQIEQRRPSLLSLMPENIATQLELREFCDLVAYLLSCRNEQRSQ